ncbi:MAG: TolC family protein, partial [Myxococcaceae bacterium]|nr:TolC family protein [Myxococcaceae bacterium]
AEATASARAGFDQQWGSLLPSLSASGGYTRNQFDAVVDLPTGATTSEKVVIIPRDQLDATLKAELPLVEVSRWLRVSAASATADAAEARERAARDQLRRAVVNAYYAVAGAQALVESSQRSLAVAKAQLQQQGDRRTAGVGSELEVARAGAEVARATQVVADAEAQLATSRRALRTLTGVEVTQPLVLPQDDLHPEPPLDELEARAAATPPVAAAERDAESAARTSSAASAALAPTLGAQFTQRFTNATGFQNQAALWNAGLTFSWRGDLGSVQGLRVASAAAQTARLTAEKARRSAVDQVHADWQRVTAALTKVTAAKAQVASAQRAQAIAKERNAAGVATQLDVIQADRDLFAAEVSDVTARFELATARASLHLSAGLSLEAP